MIRIWSFGAAWWAPIWCTWNYLSFVVKTFSAPFKRTSIAAQILLIICSHHGWHSLANRSSTLAFTDFNSSCSWYLGLFSYIGFNAFASASSDCSEWFCWLTSAENAHNAARLPLRYHQRLSPELCSHHHLSRYGLHYDSQLVFCHSRDLFTLPGAAVEWIQWFRQALDAWISCYWFWWLFELLVDMSKLEVFELPIWSALNFGLERPTQFIPLRKLIDMVEKVSPQLVVDWVDT